MYLIFFSPSSAKQLLAKKKTKQQVTMFSLC